IMTRSWVYKINSGILIITSRINAFYKYDSSIDYSSSIDSYTNLELVGSKACNCSCGSSSGSNSSTVRHLVISKVSFSRSLLEYKRCNRNLSSEEHTSEL